MSRRLSGEHLLFLPIIACGLMVCRQVTRTDRSLKPHEILFYSIFVAGLVLVWRSIRNSGLLDARSTLDQWAKEYGCEIVEKKSPLFPHFMIRFNPVYPWIVRDIPFHAGPTSTQRLYRLTLRDRSGHLFLCFAKIGHAWPPLWPSAAVVCPIEVRWVGPGPKLVKSFWAAEDGHPLRDPVIDG